MSSFNLGLRDIPNTSLGLGTNTPNTSLGLSNTQEAPSTNLGLNTQATTNLGLQQAQTTSQEARQTVSVEDISSLLDSAAQELVAQDYPDLADIVQSVASIYENGLA